MRQIHESRIRMKMLVLRTDINQNQFALAVLVRLLPYDRRYLFNVVTKILLHC
jgi:hypothetical protein